MSELQTFWLKKHTHLLEAVKQNWLYFIIYLVSFFHLFDISSLFISFHDDI